MRCEAWGGGGGKVLAVTQMGHVPMKGAGYLAHSKKAYFLAHKGIQVKLGLLVGDLPLCIPRCSSTSIATHIYPPTCQVGDFDDIPVI